MSELTPPVTPGALANPVDSAAAKDDQHLSLLAIFHFVVGGIAALLAFCPSIHLAMGIMMLVSPDTMFPPPPGAPGSQAQAGPPEAMATTMGVMMVVFASAIMLLGWVYAALMIYAGRCLNRRRRYVLCMVAAGISCLWFPFGTALGVFTIVVLMRDSVKARFGTG